VHGISGRSPGEEIRVQLITATDGSPFDAIYDPATGIMKMIALDGRNMGTRYLNSEEEFWELVAINREVTTINPSSNVDRVNRNVSWIDAANRLLIEFDENGVMTETPLNESHRELYPDSRAFSSEWYSTANVEPLPFNPPPFDEIPAEVNALIDYDQEPLYHFELDELNLSYEGRDNYLK
jgi:hypothetical protein